MNASRTIFAALLVGAAGQALLYYPQLPDSMASHFNGAGHANGWSSKGFFFGLTGFVLVLLTAFFAILPAWIQRMPARLINLPNKDYWLAPERREATMARIAAALTWFGCATVIFLNAITWLVIRFNLGLYPALPSPTMWALIGAFLLSVVLLTLRMLYLGRPPPD